MALDVLRAGLRDEAEGGDEIGLELDVVVAAIRALPPNPRAIRPGRGMLLDFLAAWEADWAAVETELVALARGDDRAEGCA